MLVPPLLKPYFISITLIHQHNSIATTPKMAWRSGSFSRTLLNTARSPTIHRSSATLRRPSPPLLPNPLRSSRRFSPTNLRSIGALGCAQSLLPLHSVVADARLTSYIAVSARACCELSQGTFCRICQDR